MTLFRLNYLKIIKLLDGIRNVSRQVPEGFNPTAGTTKDSYRRRQMGLTLMELIVILSIIAIIAAVAIPVYFQQVGKARVIRSIADLEELQLKIANFELDYNRLPDTLNEVRPGKLTDPWGSPYRYLNFTALEEASEEEEITKKGEKKKSTEAEDVRRRDLFDELINSYYDLYSCGKDGKSAASITEKQSKDDIVRGQDGSYLGLASKFES